MLMPVIQVDSEVIVWVCDLSVAEGHGYVCAATGSHVKARDVSNPRLLTARKLFWQ